MKYKYELNWWDRYDQDRWISSSVISFFIFMFTYIMLKNIPLPELPKKPATIEEFVFIEEKVQKKIATKKIIKPIEPTPQEVFEEEPEVVVEVFEPIQNQAKKKIPRCKRAFRISRLRMEKLVNLQMMQM